MYDFFAMTLGGLASFMAFAIFFAIAFPKLSVSFFAHTALVLEKFIKERKV